MWLLPVPGPSSPWCSLPPAPDDSVAVPKSPWGINIIKKNKKAVPRAFGVRLEECQPATENQVGPHHITEQAGEGEPELQGLWKQLSTLSYRHSGGSSEREQQS